MSIREHRSSITGDGVRTISAYQAEVDSTALVSAEDIDKLKKKIERVKAKLELSSMEQDAPGRAEKELRFERGHLGRVERDFEDKLASVESQEELPLWLSQLEEEMKELSRSGRISKEAAMRRRRAAMSGGKSRWKTEGPWLAGLTEDEFQRYLKLVRTKYREAFLEFVVEEEFTKRMSDIARRRRDEGLPVDDTEAMAEEAQIDLSLLLKGLRDEKQDLSSELSRLICDFFDLPAFPSDELRGYEKTSHDRMMEGFRTDNTDHGPPSTHPGAGISYLRTNAYMENHPLYGPQLVHSPVEARVLQTRNSAVARTEKAMLGVGGFTAFDTLNSSYRASQKMADTTQNLDPDIEGGNKIWVHPKKAYVDESGRIRLEIDRSDAAAVGVVTGQPIETPSSQSIGQRSPFSGRMEQRLDSPTPGTRGNANFGTGLTPGPRVQGFDAEVLRNREVQGEQGQGSQSSIDEIRNLIEQNMGKPREQTRS